MPLEEFQVVVAKIIDDKISIIKSDNKARAYKVSYKGKIIEEEIK